MGRKAGDVKVAILVASGFEQDELVQPREALHQAGLVSDIVSPEVKVKGWHRSDWGEEVEADVVLDHADPGKYDVLFLPGGVMNPDGLRKDRRAEKFVNSFFEAGKPVAALCHGPWELIDSGVKSGRRHHTYQSMRTDLQAFVEKMVEEFEASAQDGADGEADEADGTAETVDTITDGRPSRRRGDRTPAPQARHHMIVWMNKRRRPGASRGAA